MTIVKTHTGIVITKDGPQVKNCTRQSGCGSLAKTSFTTKKPAFTELYQTGVLTRIAAVKVLMAAAGDCSAYGGVKI